MEKPSSFNSEMINAILNDEKTMTRRIIIPQPVNPKWSGSEWIEAGCDDTKHFVLKCPFGKVGDCLWVRENWCVHQRYDAIPPRILPEAKYLQNGVTYLADVYKSEKSLWMGRTRPSIFMPRWAFNKYGVGCATAVFSNLWESINGKRGYGWAKNPWVFVSSFKRITP
jgi:hypothetical protein